MFTQDHDSNVIDDSYITTNPNTTTMETQLHSNFESTDIHAKHPIPTDIEHLAQQQIDSKTSLLATFVLSGMASIMSETCTYPLDVLKTRLQVTTQAIELTPYSITKSLFTKPGTFSEILMGLDAACTRHIFYSGIRVVTYEYLKQHPLIANNNDNNDIDTSKFNNTLPMWKSMICALIAGGFGQFVASPTDFVKVQMQGEGLRMSLNKPRLYSSTFNCVNTLYNKYGFFGMWNGCIPNVQRGALIQIGGLTCYDSAKYYILRLTNIGDNWITHGLSSIIAGFICTVICNPSDVVKTRIMNNPNEFSGTMNCFKNIIKYEGFFSLYTGFFPIWARLGPWNLIFFITFEKLRQLYGLKSY